MFFNDKAEWTALLRSMAALSAAALIVSCSVLENRIDCPCYLSLDFSDPSTLRYDSLLVALHSPEGYSSSVVVKREDMSQDYCIPVPVRSGVFINVLDTSSGLDYAGESSAGLHISSGEECPKVYMHTSFCPTDAENASEKIVLRKNYCTVSMTFTSKDMTGFALEVDGNICGYSIAGVPVNGDFSCSPDVDESLCCSFCVPRQTDGSMKLHIMDSEGLLRTFALGSYIVQSGYDWNAADLDDVTVRIDYASTRITVTIDEWATTESFDVTI